MKQLLFICLFVLIETICYSQTIFDFGPKAGVHYTNLRVNTNDDSGGFLDMESEGIAKMHWGAFARVGFGRVYVQPEVYYSKKGSNLSVTLIGDKYPENGGFDYSNVDVPLLLGFKVLKSKMIDFRVMAGPVFSFVTDTDYQDISEMDEKYFDDRLFGMQYGIGVDFSFFTIDARFEQAGEIYDEPKFFNGKSSTVMLTVGLKVL